MKPFPFNLVNDFYSYQTLEGEGELVLKQFNIIFAYNSNLEIILEDGTKVNIKPLQYVFISNNQSLRYCNENSGIAVCLKSNSDLKPTDMPLGSSEHVFNLKSDTYTVNKPWGRELWITGPKPVYKIVLKYIEIKAGTKTSLQTHEYKFESNFIVDGEAVFRSSTKQFKSKNDQYPLNEYKVDKPYVFDVEPLTIHQVEAVTDIVLIEASTDHLDDVIRLNDKHGRGDGRINSEHSVS